MNAKKIIKLFRIMSNPMFFRALIKGSAAGVEHSQLLNYLSSQDFKTVVDVGANRGQFALVARKCFPEAIIHSVEPLDEPAKIFLSIFENDPKVTLHQCAIGCKVGTQTIHISKQDDSSSLLPIGNAQAKLFPGTQEKETREVVVRTLDELIVDDTIPEPSLLKVDVQGFELETLKGCLKFLPQFSYIYVEASFVELYQGQALAHEIITFLDENDFKLTGVYNIFNDSQGKAIQADFFFTNQKCAS